MAGVRARNDTQPGGICHYLQAEIKTFSWHKTCPEANKFLILQCNKVKTQAAFVKTQTANVKTQAAFTKTQAAYQELG